jgi:SAM-dependent methyltransferase
MRYQYSFDTGRDSLPELAREHCLMQSLPRIDMATPANPFRFQEDIPVTTATLIPDFAAIKQRQQAVWAAGDYAIIGTTLQIVGESLCEAVDLNGGERVLDVAAGNGNATLAAARRFAEVTSTDYVAALLELGKARAMAERLPATFQVADAEALPFADASFDVALSTFGVMFAPDQDTAAAELVRVVRRGGRIGLANWTPDGFIGQLLKTVGKHVPPPAGVKPPSLWGSEARLREIFPGQRIDAAKRTFMFRYKSTAHWLDIFKTYYGPTNRAFAALDAGGQARLEAEISGLIASFNRSVTGTVVIPSEYLEVVITRQ